MAFLEEYDALGTDSGDPAGVAGARVQMVATWLATKPQELLTELRAHRSIFASPALTFVTKHADVLEVLARNEVFSVRPYAPKMERIAPTGFMLGFDNIPQYQNDVSTMRLVMRREDLPRLRKFIRQTSAQLMRAAVPQGKLDLVQGLSRIVPARVVAHYFGVPGPDEATLMRWARTIFHDLFLNLQDLPEVREPARSAGQEMGAYLAGLIAQRQAGVQAGTDEGDDVLARLLRMQCNPGTSFDNAQIRDNLLGMIVGAIDTNSKAIAHAVDELLRRPEQLEGARQAALDDNDDLLAHYIHEALRFKPQSMALVRYCERPYTLAGGTARATPLRPGTLIFAATWSAMFDQDAVEAPQEFRVDRALDTEYLHFGSGLHTCAGEYISRLQILEVIKQLLRVEGLRRAPGAEGEIRYVAGQFPDAFGLEFDRTDVSDADASYADTGYFKGGNSMTEETNGVTTGTTNTQSTISTSSSSEGASQMQGVHSYLTSITTIKPERLPQLKAILAQFGDPERVSPISVISTIHFARWVIIDNDTRLLFSSNFDGTLDSYLDEFIEKASGGLDAIWSNCEGYPAGGSKDVAAFKEYVLKSEIPNTLVYSAYPDHTVKDVNRALRTRQKFEDFLEEFQG